jgi:hypothetical protein
MKKVVIAVVVVLALIVGGGVWFVMKAKQTLNEHGIEVGKNGVSVEVDGTKVNVSGDSATSLKGSLVDMLSGSAALKCTVTDETGAHTVLAKSGKVRIDGVGYSAPGVPGASDDDKKGTMIVTEEMFYMWSGKEGMKWNVKEMEELNKKMGGENGSSATSNESLSSTDWTDWAKSMEASGAKYDCAPSVVTDADFTPPADVKFQDFGEFMKQFGAGMQVHSESQIEAGAAGQLDLSQLGAFPQ